MTTKEHLLTILAEECSEVAHRISKALRFGLKEKQKGQKYTNAERIMHEYCDLIAVELILRKSNVLLDPSPQRISLKMEKVVKYIAYAKKRKTIKD